MIESDYALSEKCMDGQEFSFTLTAKGFGNQELAGALTWTLVEGSTLPKGLTLDSKTGEMSGTPEEAGNSSGSDTVNLILTIDEP